MDTTDKVKKYIQEQTIPIFDIFSPFPNIQIVEIVDDSMVHHAPSDDPHEPYTRHRASASLLRYRLRALDLQDKYWTHLNAMELLKISQG